MILELRLWSHIPAGCCPFIASPPASISAPCPIAIKPPFAPPPPHPRSSTSCLRRKQVNWDMLLDACTQVLCLLVVDKFCLKGNSHYKYKRGRYDRATIESCFGMRFVYIRSLKGQLTCRVTSCCAWLGRIPDSTHESWLPGKADMHAHIFLGPCTECTKTDNITLDLCSVQTHLYVVV